MEHEQKKHPHANPLVYGTAHQLKGHEQEQQHGHGGVHGEFYNGFRLHASSLLWESTHSKMSVCSYTTVAPPW